MTPVMIASALLECQSLLGLARAKMLQDDAAAFRLRLLEARTKIDALDDALRHPATTEVCLAVASSETTP